MNASDVIHSREAAELLGRSTQTVIRWAETGRLPYVQSGHRGKREWLFSRAEVERRRDALALLGLVEA